MQMKKRMKTEIVDVTPAMAKVWLSRNSNNRNLREDVAHRYAKDMAEGRWHLSHQGIAFYEDGTLADGQHRLFAVTVFDKPVKLSVTYNLPRAAGQMLDQHTPRMAHDAIRIAGGGTWVNKEIVAIARFVMGNMGTDTHTKSVAEIDQYIHGHAEPLQFASSLVPQKRRNLTGAPIVANYFCAERAGVPRAVLQRFGEIMIHGEIAGPHENAAIRLREYLLQAGTSAWLGGARVETAKKVQRAISLFAAGKAISKLVLPDHLTYPIPK